MRSYQALLAGSVLALGLASSAHAAFPVYPTPGVENPITYSFSAASTGSIVAFFAGADAGDDEDLGLIINGVDQGAGVFPNHTTAVGDTFSWAVTAGDSLVFYIVDHNISTNWYSDPSLNGGFNAIYSTPYGGGDAGIPLGSYKFVSFEDRGSIGDLDYNDESFVFQNVGVVTHGDVPEPASWALMIMGFGAAGAMMRRRRTAIA